jgi:hypothetical protein
MSDSHLFVGLDVHKAALVQIAKTPLHTEE